MKNTKGAVTVFVTLLLVPAILLSGTAVDMARIHTAQSIAQDANQLAANALMTRYDALLKDLYGLFGVMAEDPALASMVNEYIEVAIFGEDWNEKGVGTFQLFYGSGLQPAELMPAPEKDLGSADVLRRQIEDYMKFRAPVLIVKELLESLSDNKLKEDTKIVGEKLEIDSTIADLYELYKKLYEAIVAADKCNQAIGGIAGGHFGSVSTSLTAIHAQFSALLSCYRRWENCEYPDDPMDFDYKSDYELMYGGILGNIKALTVGGPRGSRWNEGQWDSYYNVVGLNTNIENAKIQAENFKVKFDAVLDIASEIDNIHDELERRVDELEQKLKNGQCSDELGKAMMEPDGNGKSQIDHYREILKWDNIEGMAAVFKKGGYSYIDDEVKPMLDEVKFRNSGNPSASSLTRDQLAALPSNASFSLSSGVEASNSRAAYFAGFPESNVTYKIPPGFKKFSEHPGENGEFFAYLKMIVEMRDLDPVKLYDGQSDAKGKDGKDKQNNLVKSVLELAETAYIGLTNSPLGAKHISDPENAPPEKMGMLEIVDKIANALSDNVVDVISDPLGSMARAGDHMLLLAYCTSMFSNYTTMRPEINSASKDKLDEVTFTKSLSGVPISPEVNYFYQSEWEYLYNGSENANQNLNSVTKLIFTVRLICNYITVFRVSEISTIVNSIRTAFAWSPPVGLVVSEFARAAFVAAETVVDVAQLRSGHKVPLMKNPSEGEWKCSPSGLIKMIGGAAGGEKDGSKDEKGLSYSNYLLFFLIAQSAFTSGASSQLADRAGNLIEWNVINYKEKINADEEKMAEALGKDGRFRLSDMKTDFRITTTVDLRMLFLSLPMARRGIDGVRPPGAVPLTVSDYRGY